VVHRANFELYCRCIHFQGFNALGENPNFCKFSKAFVEALSECESSFGAVRIKLIYIFYQDQVPEVFLVNIAFSFLPVAPALPNLQDTFDVSYIHISSVVLHRIGTAFSIV